MKNDSQTHNTLNLRPSFNNSETVRGTKDTTSGDGKQQLGHSSTFQQIPFQNVHPHLQWRI